ncbi:TerB family tellurite resistance protein [Geminocystis sp. GBBB08]|uniref:TerB family tellurite resistance protein n=1 Tax=Geminocystis sp. GBBB08 TaxID=2604140 RepID=UPI0027E3A566|nr:TerB family tellurite resistance protein [Geminocystis sp. GBBB08]MBL1209934.1 TerB family tellurite resistance protein [Geminocystis sp. GBBB08]
MMEKSNVYFSESHLNILHLMSAIAWADGNLSKEETDVLLELFKTDLPVDPEPIAYMGDNMTLYDTVSANPAIYEQIQERIEAELAFKDILNSYKNNSIPLEDLVAPIKTIEDRCLAIKLAYMVVKASADDEGNLISASEKVIYRQLLQLLEIEENLVKKIEWEADKELEKFQHPFKAFMANVKKILFKKIEI